MGLLDTMFTAGLTASMTANSVKNAIESGREESLFEEKSIVLSHEKTCLGRLCVDRIRKENFKEYTNNILQITKQEMGVNNEKEPLYFIEYIAGTEDIEDITLIPNSNCYQKQFKNSRFCALTFNEIEDFTMKDQRYKLVKIHTEPIVIEKGTFDTNVELYLCEVVKS